MHNLGLAINETIVLSLISNSLKNKKFTIVMTIETFSNSHSKCSFTEGKIQPTPSEYLTSQTSPI